MRNLEKTIAKAFLEMAEGLETGSFGPRPRIALTGMGSEHGEENAMAAAKPAGGEEEVKAPPAEPCTASIPGIEVMDLEDAAKALWKAGIYAETGMGCTGPLVMMSEANHGKAQEILKAAGYIG